MQQAPQANQPEEFIKRLIDCGVFPLRASGIDILQMNITRQCNLTCKHCHVQAGPQRKEAMSRETMMECIKVAGRSEITTIDITGGAPEKHPDLVWLIVELSALKKRLIVRSNLVVMLEPAYRHYMVVFAANNVELVGSLPDYNAQKADRQRGAGTFEMVIQAIRALLRFAQKRPNAASRAQSRRRILAGATTRAGGGISSRPARCARP
jgi:radical SAM/Cys-rich protein